MALPDFFFQPPTPQKPKTAPKVKTVKGTNGDDNITAKSANEKIYLYAGNDTLSFNTTHGTDTVYIGTGSKELKFTNNLDTISVKRSGNDVKIKTKNAKNKTETLTIKNYLKGTADVTITGADSSKNLIEYFEGKQYTLGNSKSTKSLTVNGSRLDNEILNGGKAKDTINVYGGGGNVITPGKGNDKINLGDSYENIIVIKKGGGKDTITFNESVDADKIATIYAPTNTDSTFYYRKGNDLLINFNHAQTSKAAAVSEYVTIKNAFKNNELSEKLFISYDNGETEELIADSMYLSLDTNYDKNNTIAGTKYNDRIFCGIKNNDITDLNGDNVIITNTKGKNSIITGDGDDFFYVKSLDTVTTINDTAGDNELCIETNNFSDVYTVFDVASSHYSDEISDKIALLNGKNLDNFKISDLNNNNLKGVTIKEFNEDEFSIALINKKQQVSLTLHGDDITSYFVETSVRKFLDNYKVNSNTTGYTGTAYQFLADNSVSDASKKELLKIYKMLSGYDGKGLVIKEDSSNSHETQTLTLKSDGSEMITFEGKFRDTRIVNSGKYDTKGTLMTGKPYEPTTVCDDRIIIDNYSLVDNSISIGSYNYIYDNENNKIQTNLPLYTDLNMVAFDKNNKNSYTDYHKLDIQNISGELKNVSLTARSCSYKLYLQDKNRTYEVESHIANTNEAITHYIEDNHIDYVANRDNSNKILFVRGQHNYLRLAETYNMVNIYSDCSSGIDYSGGWAKITSENSNSADYYRIWNFDKNSQVMINDAGSMNGVDTDDTLFVDSDTSNLRLFFNVNKDGGNESLCDSLIYSDNTHSVYSLQNYNDNDLFIMHKDNMNAKNISFGKTFESSALYSNRTGSAINNSVLGYYNADLSINKGITIENMFSNDGKIELFQANSESGAQYLLLTDWIDAVKESVSAWLGNHSQYQDTMDVLENGSKADINSLIAVYKNTEFYQAP